MDINGKSRNGWKCWVVHHVVDVSQAPMMEINDQVWLLFGHRSFYQNGKIRKLWEWDCTRKGCFSQRSSEQIISKYTEQSCQSSVIFLYIYKAGGQAVFLPFFIFMMLNNQNSHNIKFLNNMKSIYYHG